MGRERKKVFNLEGLCGCTRKSKCKSVKCPCRNSNHPCKPSCLCLPGKCENTGSLEDTPGTLEEDTALLVHEIDHEIELVSLQIEVVDCKDRDRAAKYERKRVEREKVRKKYHNEMLELKGNIRVFCRVRPVLPAAAAAAADDDVRVISYPTSTEDVGRAIDLVHSGKKLHFTFDKVFDHVASQQDVFVEISELVQSALDGYKVSILAYGQTGSGKTYTMMGRPENPDQEGLIPRSVDQIFQTRRSLEAQGWRFAMQTSIIEIYNETIRDLVSTTRLSGTPFSPKRGGWKIGTPMRNIATPMRNIATPRSIGGHTCVQDLTILDVCSEREFSSLLQQATQRRSVGNTRMNEQSSRSHLVITLRINGVHENTDQQVEGVLNLIDLAGNERLASSGATGERMRETQAINKSLSSLSAVIRALSNGAAHVPFRDSKLTFFLQPCLEGDDAKTLMFVNVSPDSSSAGESLNSLKFAETVNACRIRRGPSRPRQTTARPSTSDSGLSCG